MRFYVDLDLLRIVATPGYSTPLSDLSVRRGDIIPTQIQFVRDGAVVDPGDDAVSVYLGIKSNGNYEQNPALVTAGPFVKAGTGTDTTYSLDIDYGSDAINHAFNVARNAESLLGMLEISWSNLAGSTWVSTSKVGAYIENDVYRGVPADSPTMLGALFLPGVTSLTGGGNTALDGIVSTTLSVPTLFVISIGNSSQLWLAQTGVDEEDVDGGVIRFDDFNAVSNPKVLKRIG